jgi:hypothetical protein
MIRALMQVVLNQRVAWLDRNESAAFIASRSRACLNDQPSPWSKTQYLSEPVKGIKSSLASRQSW